MEHMPLYHDELLDNMRQKGDIPADLFIGQQFQDIKSKIELQQWLKELSLNTHLNKLPVSYTNQDFLRSANTLPPWANPKMMQKGAIFFASHAEAIMGLLGLLSLPYCYAAANGAMVLQLSDRMRNDTGKRLFETAAFVWEVMAPDAFMPSGKGFASIVKVRLMHAAVRYYTLAGTGWNNQWGTPINQEDMAGTNLSFSLIVIRGLRKLGFAIKHHEQQAYLHLWNVIGYLLGADERLLPITGKDAQSMEAAIRNRQFTQSVHGRGLTKSLTDFLAASSVNYAYSKQEVLGLIRMLLGEEVAGMLGIDAEPLSPQKINLLRIINQINSLKPGGNMVIEYQRAYHQFKLQKPGKHI